jgi:hypothetical protein
MQLRWNFVMLERQHNLDQSSDSRRGFEMADIAFYRTNDQRCLWRSAIAKN